MLNFLTGFNFSNLDNLNAEFTVVGLGVNKEVVFKQRIKLYGKDMILDFVEQVTSKQWNNIIRSIDEKTPVSSVYHLEMEDIKVSVSK